MIKLDISIIIFLQVLFSVIIMLILWISACYRKSKRLPDSDNDFIWHCSVCLNVYINSQHEDISTCPLCGSYNKKEAVK